MRLPWKVNQLRYVSRHHTESDGLLKHGMDAAMIVPEELEHWAWCIRNASPENQPRCTPVVALGDAVIALTSNVAIKRSIKGESGYVKFDEAWFDVHNDATPDESNVAEERASLGA